MVAFDLTKKGNQLSHIGHSYFERGQNGQNLFLKIISNKYNNHINHSIHNPKVSKTFFCSSALMFVLPNFPIQMGPTNN